MKKILLLLILILTMIQYSNSQSGKGVSNTIDNAGFYYVTGVFPNGSNGTDVFIRKYSASGDTIWSNSFSGTDNSFDDEAVVVKTDSRNNVYVLANLYNTGTGYDVVLKKYDAFGSLLWSQDFAQQLNTMQADKAFGIAVDQADNVYVTGYASTTASTRIFVAKCDSASNNEWVVYPGAGELNSNGSAIVVGHSGNIFVTGYKTRQTTGADILTAKVSPAGNIAWTRTYNGLANSEDKAFGIAVDQSDNVYVTGYVSNLVNSTNTDIALLKYSPNYGILLWHAILDGGADDKAFGIAVDESTGLIYITGYSSSATEGKNYVTLCYSPSWGNKLWQTTYDGTGDSNDQPSSIALVTVSGDVVGVAVTGKSFGTDSTTDYATLVYDPSSGSQLLASRYSLNTSTNDAANEIAVSNDGVIYVTGESNMIVNSKVTSVVTSQQLDFGKVSKHFVRNPIPKNFSLYQNYPNPFNPSTKIKFDLPYGSKVMLTVYDLLGRSVSILANGFFKAGSHEVEFTDPGLSSGVYFYELRTETYTVVKNMILIK